jgi:amidase
LADLGCVVEDVLPAFDYDRLWRAWCVLRHWLVCGRLHDLYKDPAKRRSIKTEALWEIENGLGLKALEVYEASRIRSAWYQVLLRLFETYDYLALPSAQVFPFDAAVHWPKEIAGRKMDTYHRWMEVVVPGSLSGLPILNVPVGFGANGLPMGMQIIGRPRADLAVLQLGYAYEQATQWVSKRPPPE